MVANSPPTAALLTTRWFFHGLFYLAGLLGVPSTVAAQAPARIGILVQEMGRGQSQAIKGLTEELKRLGYKERRDFVFEVRNVKGNRGALQPAASELIGQNVKLIFTTGTSATRAAMATTAIPVLFVHPGDPVAAGLIKNAEERARHLTGVAAYAAQTTERRLALFKEIIPALQKILIFFDANNPLSRDNLKLAESAAKNLGLHAVGYGIKSADELKTTLSGVRAENGIAIFQVADELVESESEFLFETARMKKIPTMFNEESWAIGGALAAYGPNYLEMGRQAGRLADKIIKSHSPGSLPLERASKFDLTINYRTARFIGVELSSALLKKADKVIR
jgi:putative ABC transport system substrate-binding protein